MPVLSDRRRRHDSISPESLLQTQGLGVIGDPANTNIDSTPESNIKSKSPLPSLSHPHAAGVSALPGEGRAQKLEP